MEELNRVAPSKWYQDYLIPLAQDFPYLEDIFGERLEEEQTKAVTNETPEGDDEEDLHSAMAYERPKWDDE